MCIRDRPGADGKILLGPAKIFIIIMSVAHAGSVIVPDPSDKLIAPAIFQLPASQHCAAKIRQQMEFFAQTADMKGEMCIRDSTRSDRKLSSFS